MGEVLGVIAWLKANGSNVAAVLLAVVALGEAVVKLTPTETDDGFVKRVGGWVDKLLSWLPNNVKPPV